MSFSSIEVQFLVFALLNLSNVYIHLVDNSVLYPTIDIKPKDTERYKKYYKNFGCNNHVSIVPD